ncbi:MAG: IclR family transcriptional regulator [Deltaproteobacteria bacterium]|nr:IclR family transcriptional regulator [Deltaproteobacteria bacterium]MBW2153774.1 IclR family transcriptional regulator [Deltaproteobacteria bacterium]
MQRDQLVISLLKAGQIIETLVSTGENDLRAISNRLKMPKSTVRRLLLTLISMGYVEQDKENACYKISMRFVELGLQVMEHYDFIHISRPFMVELAERTGETVNLGILDGSEIVLVDQVSSKHSLRQDQPLGSRILSHCTAFGKSILAYLPIEELDRLFKNKPLRTLTPKSLKSYSDLKKELKLTRDRGYAVDDEEAVTGVRCVAAPLLNNLSTPIAGLSVAGPAIRITKKRFKSIGPLVRDTAMAISAKMGGRTP